MSSDTVEYLVGFDPASMSGHFQVLNRVVTITSEDQLGVPSNPGRVALMIFQNYGPIPVANARCTWNGTGDARAYRLLVDLPRVIKYSDVGNMVGYDWYFRADGYPWSLGVWEVIYRAKAVANKVLQCGPGHNGLSGNKTAGDRRKANRFHR